jgi:NTP pyrophosphatase (non-canonical NTP hydrolase)/nucleoside 2-deoxyribosyltransferase
MKERKAKISATISGSFNKDLNEIQNKIHQFQQEGIEILSPKLSRAVSVQGGFVKLEEDKGTPGKIESRHLEAISRSDFLYIVNPGGYIGRSVAFEIGYASSKGIPVYSLEKPEDIPLSFFVKPKKRIETIKRELSVRRHKIPRWKHLTLKWLQDYVQSIIKLRGFGRETIEDAMLLLVEEVGELAKAVRNLLGLRSSRKRDLQKNVREELADCLIYLLDIANLANIDLEDAFREKERHNSRRKWRYGDV